MAEGSDAQFDSGTPAMVCTRARIEGDVKVGNGCVLHPRVRITAAAGSSIEIGENNVIEETVEISCNSGKMLVGNSNVFEVGCQVVDSSIGNFCIVEAKAHLQNAVVEDNCCIGAGVFHKDAPVPASTSIYPPRNDAVPGRDAETHKEYVAAHLAWLRKRLPKFPDLEPVPMDKLKPASSSPAKPLANENSL